MHVRPRALCAALLSAAALVTGVALPTPASAETGSYRIDNWSQPPLTYARLWETTPVITPPAGIPANATITRIHAFVSYQTPPKYGSTYESRFCDYDTGVCKNMLYASQSRASYPAITDEFAGKPAATFRFTLQNRENDFQGGSIYPALSPVRYLSNGRYLIVNYQYTPAASGAREQR